MVTDNYEREVRDTWLNKDLINFVVFDTQNLCKPDGAALSTIWSNGDGTSRYATSPIGAGRAQVSSLLTSSRMSLRNSLFAAPTTIQTGFCLRLAHEDRETSNSDPERTEMLRACLSQIWDSFKFDAARIIPTLTSRDKIMESITNAADLAELLRLTDLYDVFPLADSKAGQSSEDPVAAKLLLECSAAPVDDLKYTLLIFAHRIVCNGIPRLTTTSNGNRFPTSCAKAIVTTIVRRYASMYVGARPTPPRSHALRVQFMCTCHDCNQIDGFLRSPTETVGRFPMAKKRRQHLDHIFAYRGTTEYSVETLGGTNPNIWQITKTTHTTAIAQEKAWKARARELWREVESLGNLAQLRDGFGADLFKAIQEKDLEAVMGAELAGQQNLPLTEVTNSSRNKRPRDEDASALGGAGPSKRFAPDSGGSAKVIDLTDD